VPTSRRTAPLCNTVAHELGLYGCAVVPPYINCFLTHTRLSGGSQPIRPSDAFSHDNNFIDNFGIEHKLVRAVWIDGKGNPHEAMSTTQSIPLWFELQFDDADPTIKNGRIELRAFTGGKLNLKSMTH
jgi:hypothetical protein